MSPSSKQNSVPQLEQKNILKYGVPTSEKQRAKTLPIMTKTLSNQSFSPLIALLMARSITPKNLVLQRRENRPQFPNICTKLFACLKNQTSFKYFCQIQLPPLDLYLCRAWDEIFFPKTMLKDYHQFQGGDHFVLAKILHLRKKVVFGQTKK